ncbi:MAG: Inositol 2-dehydrogenase [Candidatus Ordinivivax streblomastigis]|uniref:Inositol 2-dehydrogenase n=1 Tax=Candidatus Ordinivivax streblomastigis TaxID=2540710 RepID=A0A5M8P094_9BACT|nr:MAG: Inositol 2-dehydrogenase [Candidatus Ordinivivax streblomastigis]
MQQKPKIQFAVAGCGHIGKRHIEMIQRNSEAELVAVCDINPTISIDGLETRPYKCLEELLESTEFDVLNICTPNGIHAPMAIRGLETNHHVVIEKPMSLTTIDAGKILQTAEKHNKKVFCVMQNRYSPPSVWIKDVIEHQLLGRIFVVQINCFWNRDERYYQKGGWHGSKDLDGGTLFTQFSHFIDLMFWLFGDITNIQARFADFNHQQLTDFEDSGAIAFEFVNGGIGTFNYSTSIYDVNFESSVTIIGEKGTIKIGGQYMNQVEYCRVKDYIMPELAPTNPGNDYGAYKGSAQNHHYMIDNVVNVLKNKAGEKITTNAYEGYKVVDIIERMYKEKS